jgi:hypothetical protein
MKYDGTVMWYRTDSFWNKDGTIVASSWGPGTANAGHYASGSDNSSITSVNDGKGYVFALYDGSGI